MNIGVFIDYFSDLDNLDEFDVNDNVFVFINPYYTNGATIKDNPLVINKSVSLYIYLPLSFLALSYTNKAKSILDIAKKFKLDTIYLPLTRQIKFIKNNYHLNFYPSYDLFKDQRIIDSFYLNNDYNYLAYLLMDKILIKTLKTKHHKAKINSNQLSSYLLTINHLKYHDNKYLSESSFNYLKKNLLTISNSSDLFKLLKTKSIISSNALLYLFTKSVKKELTYHQSNTFYIFMAKKEKLKVVKDLKIKPIYDYQKCLNYNFVNEREFIKYYELITFKAKKVFKGIKIF